MSNQLPSPPSLILKFMEDCLLHNPPEPFILAGRLERELGLSRTDLYVGIGQLLGTHLGVYKEGKRKYYYLLEMVRMYRDALKGKRR